MAAKRRRTALNTWLCEEAKGERWSARLYKDLLQLGKPVTCKQHLCSKMKERLERHQMSCPATRVGGDRILTARDARPQVKRTIDHASGTTRKSSIGVSTRRIDPFKRKSKIQSAQTSLTINDFEPSTVSSSEMHAQTITTFIGNPNYKEINNSKENKRRIHQEEEEYNHDDDIVSVKPTQNELKQEQFPVLTREIHDVSPNGNGYNDRLYRVIHEFFHDIPVFPNTSETVKQKRLRIIDDFAAKIADLLIFINDEDYHDKVEHEIEECLRVLPMWEPQTKQDINGFKHCLGDALFTLIRTFNEKWHSLKKLNFEMFPKNLSSSPDNKNKRNEFMEKDIISWVDNNLKCSSKNYIVANKLIKNIKPLLDTGINDKHIIRAEIVNALEELSPYLQLPENQEKHVNILASDLTNLIKDNESNDYQLIDKTEDETINQITDVLFGHSDLTLHDKRPIIVKEIRRILKCSGGFSDSEASSLAKTLMTNVRDCIYDDDYIKKCGQSHSNSYVVLTSEQDISDKSGPPIHSTPSNNVPKKEIPTIDRAEKLFIEKVSAIVRNWLDSTNMSFETMEDQIFKETIVDDITNDVHNIVKETGGVRIGEGLLNKIIIKGIRKYDLFTRPVNDKSLEVVDLRTRILALDTDDILDKSAFIEPQHGNRQDMASIRFRNDSRSELEVIHQPKVLDILEDNISVWMNEQPSDIFKPYDKPTRNKLMREVATNLQAKIERQTSDYEIKKELKQWLNKVVDPKMKRNVDGLAENLKDRIVKLPHDESLTRVHQRRINEEKQCFYKSEHNSFKDDQKFSEFINKNIRKYNVDDDVVNGVIKLILKRELYNLSQSARDKLFKNNSDNAFNTDEVRKEIKIAKEVHDWLKNIPFYYPLLKPGPEVIQFVHSLARNIADIEKERIKYPNRTDFYSWLHTEIATYMLQKDAAITNDEDKLKIDHYAGQLCLRILSLRAGEENTDELYKIITDHMNKYDSLLAADYLKKILWHRRLGEAVKKLLLAKPAASRTDVEKTLVTIPLPHDNSVIKYQMEIKYNTTIHDWLHALPLVLPKNSEEEYTRKNKVQELLQKIIEIDERKAENPEDTKADEDLDNYIAFWISQLQFETMEHTNVLTLASQLRRGLEYVKWTEMQLLRSSGHGITRSRGLSKALHDPKQKDPGELMVQVVENWCNNLPITEENDEATNARKKQITTQIFQILGSLNADPRVDNDNQKFKNMLDNEIEILLQNLSKHKSVNENKDTLKAALVDKLIEIKNMIRDITAGDDYVQALENSIDASSTDALRRSPKHDPAYELFKKRAVMLWLLENYDNAVDFLSLKYKKMLSEEVRSLTEEIQKRNLFPADKDEMMNDIMNVFYAANPPNEDAIFDEIEKIKLKCEIEIWANELPLKEVLSYDKILERDQILTILSKLLFDIERSEETDVDEMMRMEINKWTEKLPLLSGEKGNIPKYSELLMCLLKASTDSRRCQRQEESKNLTAVEETLSKLKSDDVSLSKANQENTSQIAGPSKSRSCAGHCGVSPEQLGLLINKAINNWCSQLPLSYGVADEQNVVQGMKELIFQRLIHFVSELNYRPNTLNNEGLYEYHLNLEIDGILTELSNEKAYWEEQRSRNERKYQLINALKAIRPLVQEVKDRELYKEKLRHTISSFRESMAPHSATELSEQTQMAILDDFVQYKSHKGDFENQELYKLKINDALKNELSDQAVDSLLAANRLICELSKVEPPAHSQKKKAYSSKHRRYSEPNPANINRLSSTPESRRQSLPYPLPNSDPNFVPTQTVTPHGQNMTVPESSSYPRKYSTPLSTSLPAPRVQRTPDFRQSLPLSQRDIQPQFLHNLPPVIYPSSALEMRPFPLPPPVFNQTNDSNFYQPPVRQTLYRRPDQFAEQSYRERELYDQQLPPEPSGMRQRAAKARNSAASTAECPEEGRGREKGQANQGFCELCDKDDDCAYNMPHPPLNPYMYF